MQAPLCIALNVAASSCGDAREVSASQGGAKVKEFSNSLHVEGWARSFLPFAIADYVELPRPTITLLHLPDHTSLARDYVLAAEANDPLLHDWLPDPPQPARVIELADANANPWQNGPSCSHRCARLSPRPCNCFCYRHR